MTTTLKRKLPPEAYPNKICVWCGAVRVRKRQSLSEWNKILTCGGSCAAHWKHKHYPRTSVAVEVDRFCVQCGNLLIRRTDEPYKTWLKRLNCNKSCAASGKTRQRTQPAAAEVSDEVRLGLIRYIPGTPEFRAIAAQYGG